MEDPDAIKHLVFSGHEDLPKHSVPETVLRSWRRLAKRGLPYGTRLNPSKTRTGPSVSSELLALFRRVGPMARGLLGDPDYVGCMLVDRFGKIALLDIGAPFAETLSERGLSKGMSFAEREAGTNAVDMAIRERSVAVTHGVDHTNLEYEDLSFYCMPLFGEASEVLGAISIVVPSNASSDGLLEALKLLATMLEAVLQQSSSNNELERLLAQQHAIADATQDGTMTIDRDGVVEYMNRPAGKILGVDPSEAIGRPLSETLGVTPVIQPIFESGQGYQDREVRLKTRKRSLHLIDTAIPITNGAGEVMSVVNTFRDFGDVAKVARRLTGNRAQYTFDNTIGKSEAFLRAVSISKRAAKGTSNVLLTGESGTGKEVFAQGIHNESNRSSQPFVAINCAAIPKDLIETELFGYVGGSFTGAHEEGSPGKFEIASGGTIFLDEISEMPIDVQAKLLRVLQERQVTRLGDNEPIELDIRVIAATNRKVEDMIANGGFREDLYYRINVIEIPIPALRDREGDITALVRHYAGHYGRILGKPSISISDEILRLLNKYDWPGNVRELQNVVDRLVNFADDDVIDRVSDLPPVFQNPPSAIAAMSPENTPGSSLPTLEEAERILMEEALERSSYNVTRACELLQMTKPRFYRKAKAHGVSLQRAQSTE